MFSQKKYSNKANKNIRNKVTKAIKNKASHFYLATLPRFQELRLLMINQLLNLEKESNEFKLSLRITPENGSMFLGFTPAKAENTARATNTSFHEKDLKEIIADNSEKFSVQEQYIDRFDKLLSPESYNKVKQLIEHTQEYIKIINEMALQVFTAIINYCYDTIDHAVKIDRTNLKQYLGPNFIRHLTYLPSNYAYSMATHCDIGWFTFINQCDGDKCLLGQNPDGSWFNVLQKPNKILVIFGEFMKYLCPQIVPLPHKILASKEIRISIVSFITPSGDMKIKPCDDGSYAPIIKTLSAKASLITYAEFMEEFSKRF